MLYVPQDLIFKQKDKTWFSDKFWSTVLNLSAYYKYIYIHILITLKKVT
jgi:hypothetical protein